jgi:hypothetical protein
MLAKRPYSSELFVFEQTAPALAARGHPRLTLEELKPRITRIAQMEQEVSHPCNPRHPRQFFS